MAREADIDWAELRRQLAYSKTTGLFTRKVQSSNRVKVGDVAGTVSLAGYVQIRVCNVLVYGHRLARFYVRGVWPEGKVDHRNGLRHDNRWRNLRDIDDLGNSQNRHRPSSLNTTGMLGVSRTTRSKSNPDTPHKFKARIRLNGEVVYLGSFPTPELAHAAYMAAKRDGHKHYHDSEQFHGKDTSPRAARNRLRPVRT